MVATLLFLAIASTQYYYAEVANSSALKADSISMFADALSFFGAFLAEVLPQNCLCGKEIIELLVSGISLLILFVFTIKFLVDASQEINTEGGGEDDVNGNVVLYFALVGVLFDVASFFSYVLCGRHHSLMSDDENDSQNDVDGATIELAGAVMKDEDESPLVMTRHIGSNMRAALLHIYSDTLRSLTTLVAGIVILSTEGGSSKIDAVATLVVCSIILLGAVFGVVSWCHDCNKYYRK
eukprot:CAMPEP_0114367548 /NCGR_PEP_ID=MMETSP0101-20121206/30141_1 /TAXON_ID=38822 ORGANISM="Pteridomonas danica, Strain PT" /NCGR_SAMPLE_ID=MMETSP0101 /ASSEMBLY_ACC=CAM_ASM_000211 /LENGTH=238 /DNA_ID=CAMNT_0001517229 /DNA_START=45 /DNA_END=761 /DNA_ORIENTATION=+